MANGIDVALLDRSIRPCDDFYRFANGAWLATAAIPPEEGAWGAFAEIRERNHAVLREILEEAAADTVRERARTRQLVGDLFASGMDEAGIERADLAPIADDLARIDRTRTALDRTQLLAELHSGRAFPGFSISVLPDAKDSRTSLFQLQQGGLGLPDRDYYLKDDDRSKELRTRYGAHVARMLELLGHPDPARDAETVVRLETRLARASMTRVEQRDPHKVYNKQKLAELEAGSPGFGWPAYLAALGITDSVLNVRQPAFFAELALLSRDESAEDWHAYLRWQLVHARAPYLPARFEDEHFAFFRRVLHGVPTQHPRWKRVLETADQRIGEALGQLYVERAFPPEAKQQVNRLVEDLRDALGERIEGLDWMTDATKAQALQKLRAFRVKMGYPDRWRDYSGLEIDRGPYLANVVRADRFEMRRILRKLGRPVDREEWRMSPPTVNAYYASSYNEIVFPAGILQPPLFDPKADDAVNYGAIGMIIGHELTHGFDDAGSQFDAEGNLREWWVAEDRAAYTLRTDLVVRQYEEYEAMPGHRVNGRLTLGENIADLGGLKIAFAAFMRRARARAGDADGFTPEQRFFLGFAQGCWRSLWREEAMRVRLTVDPHSPPQYRCNGPLSNLPEFFDAFGCAEAGTMARPPEVRPAIW